MRFTYTIDIDVKRSEGANVRKPQVSAELVQRLFDMLIAEGEPFTVANAGGDDYAYMTVEDVVVYPHENSKPPEDFAADRSEFMEGDECPTCKITQIKHRTKASA